MLIPIGDTEVGVALYDGKGTENIIKDTFNSFSMMSESILTNAFSKITHNPFLITRSNLKIKFNQKSLLVDCPLKYPQSRDPKISDRNTSKSS